MAAPRNGPEFAEEEGLFCLDLEEEDVEDDEDMEARALRMVRPADGNDQSTSKSSYGKGQSTSKAGYGKDQQSKSSHGKGQLRMVRPPDGNDQSTSKSSHGKGQQSTSKSSYGKDQSTSKSAYGKDQSTSKAGYGKDQQSKSSHGKGSGHQPYEHEQVRQWQGSYGKDQSTSKSGKSGSGHQSTSTSPASPAAVTRARARERLVTNCFTMRNTVMFLKDKFEEGDKAKIDEAVSATLEWLELEQRSMVSSTSAFEAKQKELEDVVIPIMMKVIVAMPYLRW